MIATRRLIVESKAGTQLDSQAIEPPFIARRKRFYLIIAL
jgi:hypothetical protein